MRVSIPRACAFSCALALLSQPARAAAPPVAAADLRARLQPIEADLVALYRDLHQHPELSGHEERTAEVLAARLRSLGAAVTTGVGGHGVVGVLANGAGPTLLLRADLDALPVREETGLPHASRVTARDEAGQSVPVMHACGHDFHMTSLVGTAMLLSELRDRWHGTVLFVGQPAEEKGEGAQAMLRAGLYTRFPRPRYVLALHDSAELPAGKVGYTPGYALANVDSVDITIFGKGGHGAYPHTTVDPIVIAARSVTAFQDLISREKNPLDPAVITVGSIHGGTKHNVIPNEVQLQLTVRSYDEKLRERLLAGIRRVVRSEAELAQAPRPPLVTVSEGTHATYNDPALAERAAAVFRRVLPAGSVVQVPPVMGGEDFGEFARAGVPGLLFWVGAVRPELWTRAQKDGQPLPSLHSARFAPDVPAALRTAVLSMSAVSLDLLGG